MSIRDLKVEYDSFECIGLIGMHVGLIGVYVGLCWMYLGLFWGIYWAFFLLNVGSTTSMICRFESQKSNLAHLSVCGAH